MDPPGASHKGTSVDADHGASVLIDDTANRLEQVVALGRAENEEQQQQQEQREQEREHKKLNGERNQQQRQAELQQQQQTQRQQHPDRPNGPYYKDQVHPLRVQGVQVQDLQDVQDVHAQEVQHGRTVQARAVEMGMSGDDTTTSLQLISSRHIHVEPNLGAAHARNEIRSSHNDSTHPLIGYKHYMREAAPAPTAQTQEQIATTIVVPPHRVSVSELPMPPEEHPQRRPSHVQPRKRILENLAREGFPSGLALELLSTAEDKHPLRFWVVDNSGSMIKADCQRLLQGASTKRNQRTSCTMVPCNRWSELQATVEYHAHLAGLLEWRTIFRFLNDPGANICPQEFTVSSLEDAELGREMMEKAEPLGTTPLTQRVREIYEQINACSDSLRANGKKSVVVLATDGLPSNEFGESPPQIREEFLESLKMLQTLPVWIVVRLCTDDAAVLKYYHRLDSNLELPLEVIDDYMNEAKEINKHNKWLNYAMPLHRCREMGYYHRLLDLLDERPLTKEELPEFLKLLFGKAAFRDAPDVHASWKDFITFASLIMSKEKQQWCPINRKMEDWINFRKLNQEYGGGLMCNVRRMVGNVTDKVSDI